mmetsp:Transcript_51980/g.143912  ORF Transcript_51980/g.143912 Transcript_51980/m.143912 type:complete len:234 (+) Transcript_51980:522-1223(+)
MVPQKLAVPLRLEVQCCTRAHKVHEHVAEHLLLAEAVRAEQEVKRTIRDPLLQELVLRDSRRDVAHRNGCRPLGQRAERSPCTLLLPAAAMLCWRTWCHRRPLLHLCLPRHGRLAGWDGRRSRHACPCGHILRCARRHLCRGLRPLGSKLALRWHPHVTLVVVGCDVRQVRELRKLGCQAVSWRRGAQRFVGKRVSVGAIFAHIRLEVRILLQQGLDSGFKTRRALELTLHLT